MKFCISSGIRRNKVGSFNLQNGSRTEPRLARFIQPQKSELYTKGTEVPIPKLDMSLKEEILYLQKKNVKSTGVLSHLRLV